MRNYGGRHQPGNRYSALRRGGWWVVLDKDRGKVLVIDGAELLTHEMAMAVMERRNSQNDILAGLVAQHPLPWTEKAALGGRAVIDVKGEIVMVLSEE